MGATSGLGKLCVWGTWHIRKGKDRAGSRKQSSELGTEQEAETRAKKQEGKGIRAALREISGLICGILYKKVGLHWTLQLIRPHRPDLNHGFLAGWKIYLWWRSSDFSAWLLEPLRWHSSGTQRVKATCSPCPPLSLGSGTPSMQQLWQPHQQALPKDHNLTPVGQP